ncbi:biotin transporter BioY [Halobellus clavatus]|jgi:biotin transport system substrate-specific component|uniref:Biotin transport system substrate-specific component n=1 Tax=Halobellus clavatus TaxID=660517 RepID=A0A1H3ELV5_9EURY|nr:biotin transporter BioY [Halobellus clavatus]SDX78944.1 biotin transport system substrate-specific component [Halobellus clavatus]
MSTETESVELVGEDVVGNVARAALFAALTGAFAYVSFPNPISPVPVSLQVLGVFLAGIFLGPVWGGVSLAFYLAAGAAGAPVFAGGSAGFGPLVGYTAGYLWSYPIAASLIGGVVHGFDGLADPETIATGRLVLGMLVGTVVIYALGTVGFSVVQNVGLVEAFTVSALAFVPFEAVKIAAAVGVVRSDAAAAA